MSLSLEQLHAAFMPLLPPANPPRSAGADPAPGTPSPAPATPIVPGPAACRTPDFKTTGYHLDATVAPDRVVAAAQLLDQHGFAIDTITGVDWIAEGQMEVVYDFFHPTAPWQVVVRTRVLREQPELPTISKVFPGANWHERETHDFFGIRFLGHPDLRPLLLPRDATYHPLRKDFAGAA